MPNFGLLIDTVERLVFSDEILSFRGNITRLGRNLTPKFHRVQES